MLTRSGIVGRDQKPKFALGVNLGGLQGAYPAAPSLAEISYFVNRGIKTFRLPLAWAQFNSFYGLNTGIQPVPFGPLDTTSTYMGTGGYLGQLDTVVSNAATLGATLLLDIHQFGGSSGLAGSFSITSLSSSGSTVTATTSAAANLVNGANVSIAGATPAAYNGSFNISNVTSTTFQYTAGSAPGTTPATGTIYGSENAQVGTPRLPVTAFADLWGKISAHYKGNPGIRGYDLMNEWINGFDISIVMAANQAAINAIRANGDLTKIYIEGTNYSGSWNWVSGQGQPYNNANLFQLIDPADNLVFSTHCYLDRDSSGSHFSWAAETADPGESPPGTPVSHTIGVTRLTPVVQWAQQHNVRLHLGEIGFSNDALSSGGNDDYTDWNTTMDNMLAFCQANNVEVDVWGGGPAFPPSYPFCMEPSSVSSPGNKDFTSAGLQATQMVLLEKYSGYAGSQPTAYRLDLPLDGSLNKITRGSSGVATGNFTIRYGGKITSPVTITPYANYSDGTSAGGTFTPSTVTLSAGNNAIAYFTYTPAVAATLLIGTTNTAGWTDPPTLGFTTATDNFQALSASPVNIFGLRRLYAPYVGPAIRLQRSSDSTQMDFYFNNRGDLPRQAIQTWASSRTVNIVTIYDQSPNGNNLTYTGSNYPILTLKNTYGYPEVTWASNSKMDFNSADAGQTGHTVMARINDTSGEAYFIRQDEYVGAFYFGPSGYSVGSGSPFSAVTFTPQVGSWHHYAGTFQSNTTNGIVGYVDGAQTTAANSQNYTMATAGGPGTQMGYFRFYAPAYWVGSWQNVVILNGAITGAQVAAFASSDTTYYSTALPDSLSAVNPTISSVVSSQSVVGAHFSVPFGTVTVSDGNSGATDSVSITLSGDSGATLSGAGLSGTGPYTISSATPASITTTLKALQYQSTSSTGAVGTLTLTVTSSATTTATATVTMTVIAYASETPFAAPSGTWTPVSGAASWKGVNIDGGENQYPTTNQYNYVYPQNQEIDYFASKGFGLIRMPISMPRLQPTPYAPLDPAVRPDNEPANGYDTWPAGSSTNLLSMKRAIDYAFTKGIRIIIDPHNYGYSYDSRTGTSRLIGVDSEGTAIFVDWWTRMATKFKNYPNVVFGLMNEPNAQTATQWQGGAVAAINAIAAVTTAQVVLIPGTSYTGAQSWVSSGNGAAWHAYTPPTGLTCYFEMHEYLDSDNSGTHAVCQLNKGSTCLAAATSWLATEGQQAILGECGWSTDSSCPTEGAAIMSYMSSNASQWKGWTYWLGGSYLFYASYMYTVTPSGYPSGPFTDKPQMSILTSNL